MVNSNSYLILYLVIILILIYVISFVSNSTCKLPNQTDNLIKNEENYENLKTETQMDTSTIPLEGEVFLYQNCNFGGFGSKLTTGQYANLNDIVNIKSLKLGINTKLTLFSSSNFQGNSNVFLGNSDIVNKDFSCIDVSFLSAKVEKYNALPSVPSELTTEQINNLWTEAGCKAEAIGLNNNNMTKWKQQKNVSDVISDMKNFSSEPSLKTECYTLPKIPNIPDEGEVVLFEKCNFEGQYKKFGLGNIPFVGNDFNNLTSSIKIGPNTSITIYENKNFTGKNINWKNNSNNISSINCLTSNNFDKLLSSLKISYSNAQVNYNLDIDAKPVFNIGPWNLPPWGLSNFVDTTAQWIWHTKNSTQNAPVDNQPVKFQLIVPISGVNNIPVVINVIADNAPQGANFVKLNENIIGQIIDAGWTTPNYTKLQTHLVPGNNLIEFYAQNHGGSAGLLVSVINSNTNEVIANSGSGIWGWVYPVSTENNKSIGNIVKFKNHNEINQMMVNGTFRLCVNLTNVPPYIKGVEYKAGENNKFYLCVEKIDPNCQIQEDNKCFSIYVDNNKCSNATLSNITRLNSYRLVLIPSVYVLNPNVPFGKNVDFTLVKVYDKLYLKNVQTGYMPKLFTNDYKQPLYGYMDDNYLSNINTIKSNQNKLCGSSETTPKNIEKFLDITQKGTDNIKNILNQSMSGLLGTTEEKRPNQKFVNCMTNADGNMYLLTTKNLVESNPVKFIINKDGNVNIRLQFYNSYGNVDKTFSLIYCNFNVNTYAFIEKLTNPLGTFFINMVCFDSDNKRQLPKNNLDFSVEISKYSDTYLKEKNIYNLNS
jgi:hypothetical protein